jgi:GNAT superfamily N-acetyltransferase
MSSTRHHQYCEHLAPGPAVTGMPGGRVEIVRCRLDDEDAARLLRAFYDEQVGRYGFAESIALDPGHFAAAHGGFAVVYLDGQPAGCGGWRWHDRTAGVAEFKKTFLVPAARGIGAGRALLVWLERDAVAAGAVQGILETGVRNTAALGLFTSQGYQPIPSYVPGRPPEINRAFTRPLTRQDRPS